MYMARVVTPWVAATPSRGNHPKIDDDYSLYSWSDVTGQDTSVISPDPNAYTVEIICEDTVLTALNSDSDYVILWSEEIIEEAP